jgi:hypothetical protein
MAPSTSSRGTLHLPHALDLLRSPGRRRRRQLAAKVRRRSHEEREQLHRAGVVELDSVRIRTALYEVIAARLENVVNPIPDKALDQVEQLLAEPPPVRDYGTRARDRNERIAAVVAALEQERAP